MSSAAPAVDLDAIADRILDACRGADEAEIAIQTSRMGLTRFANSFIHQNVAEETTAAQLVVNVGGRIGRVGSNQLHAEGITRLAANALEIARLSPPDADHPGMPAADEGGTPGPEHFDAATFAAEPDARGRQVAAFIGAGAGFRAAGYVDTDGTRAAYANSHGRRCRGLYSRASVDGIQQSDTSSGFAHQTSNRLADIDGAAAGEVAAQKAEAGRDAVELEPGNYEVLLEPAAVGTLLIFLAFYGINAKQHIEGQSYVELGTRQFSPLFTLTDDAGDPRAIGLPYDTEGVAKRHLELVTDGVSVALAHDRRTAHKAGTESTGHGAPGSSVYGPIPTNLFLKGGDTSFADMLRGVDRGILVTRFNYNRILDPKTTVVTGLTRDGTFLVERGEIVKPLQNFRYTQSYVEALRSIVAVGEAVMADNEFGAGLTHCPPLHLERWNFTGSASG